MKEKVLTVVLVILLFTTGCSCEYNLKIENDLYKEEIKLFSNDKEEINSFNNNWEIPTNKSEYNRPGDPDSTPSISNGKYKYQLTENNLLFSNDFKIIDYSNSSAVSVCYNQFAVEEYDNSIIISTSQEIDCFNKYPTLDKITINITVDRPVKSNNADIVNNNIYTWNITKNNNKRAVNLVLENDNNVNAPTNSSNTEDSAPYNKKHDYSLYIVLIIILIIFLLGYLIFKKIKNREDSMDD